jgi:hypothetical protein
VHPRAAHGTNSDQFAHYRPHHAGHSPADLAVVRCWHKTDIDVLSVNVRFREERTSNIRCLKSFFSCGLSLFLFEQTRPASYKNNTGYFEFVTMLLSYCLAEDLKGTA